MLTWDWIPVARYSIPAWLMFFGWLLTQFLIAWLQAKGMINISAMAHLGGAAVGFAFWLVTLMLEKNVGNKHYKREARYRK